SAGAPSPRSVFYYDSLSDDEPRHFLDSCFLCNKVLSGHKDIFMYEGDKPFCSEDCRQKQMDFDEKKEQEEKMKLKMKMKMKSFSSSSSS
ncbi:4Fe-4S ferredoxins domain-containing protein, partial [Dioscorea alata]